MARAPSAFCREEYDYFRPSLPARIPTTPETSTKKGETDVSPFLSLSEERDLRGFFFLVAVDQHRPFVLSDAFLVDHDLADVVDTRDVVHHLKHRLL